MPDSPPNVGEARRFESDAGFRVLVAGGGVAGLEAMLALRALAGELVELELLSHEHDFWYRPLSVAEPFGLGHAHRFELAHLTEAAGASFTPGELSAVDPKAHKATTSHGAEISYDALVIACGATPRPAVPGALTFRGPADTDTFRELLEEIKSRAARRVVFALPRGVVWPLPIYELALLTAAYVSERELRDVELALVTHEPVPLSLFGRAASEAVSGLLAERGIALHLGRYPVRFERGTLQLAPKAELEADRVVALPRLEGRPIDGVPHNHDGFIRVDENGRVRGLEDVYAAGDITSFPVKQGGIATQQADAVAEAIAARVGADVDPRPFDPVLRGLLLTGGVPAYLRAELRGGRGDTSTVAGEALWWPSAKIAGRYLAPFLATFADLDIEPPGDLPGALTVEAMLATAPPD